ncbi:unnamed protein product [Ceutorhynchus assimilis]|uniref:Uncharacterized protein n=1 Tax=Ceutorhynchus assimilis TaxID=467358 RepID=A0A9N9MPE5_9CUCU|nr:unnamed protein product [Ceutorhynchus assimilis]
MANKDETNLQIGFGVWVCFCILASLWMISKFLRGKQQVFSNLHVVEDSLRKLQERMELEERRKSMGYMDIDSLEELTRRFENVEECQQENEDGGKPLLSTENAIGELGVVAEDQNVEDKKNI